MQENKNRIWSHDRGKSLGDVLGALNYILNISEAENTIEKIFVGGNSSASYKINSFAGTASDDSPCRLNTKGKIETVTEIDDVSEGVKWDRSLDWVTRFTSDYYPTNKVWEPNQNKIISYQLWGKNGGGRCKKVSIKEKAFFEKSFAEKGYELHLLDETKSLEECVEILSKSKFYVGVDTGITHLALCVGTPIHLIRNCRSLINVLHSYRHKADEMNIYRNMKHFFKIYNDDENFDEGMFGIEQLILRASRRGGDKHIGMQDDKKYNNVHLIREIQAMTDVLENDHHIVAPICA